MGRGPPKGPRSLPQAQDRKINHSGGNGPLLIVAAPRRVDVRVIVHRKRARVLFLKLILKQKAKKKRAQLRREERPQSTQQVVP